MSVVIPCRNGEKYLDAAITSVLEQTWNDSEVIIVDDGSQDRTPEVARGFGDAIRYHRQEPTGAGAARNTGVNLCTGAFLAFLDADDVWPKNSLSLRMAEFVKDPKLDLVSGNARQFISPDLPEHDKARLYCPSEPAPTRLPGSMTVRRESFDRVGGFPTDVLAGEALDWFMRAEEIGLRSRTINSVVLLRRLHTTNIGVVNRENRSDYLRIVKRALDRRRAIHGNPAPTKDRP